MTNFDPEAPGRGPSRLDLIYRWDRVDDLPVIGKFVGVVLGVRKGADTLMVRLANGTQIGIRYEHLISAIQAKPCPACGRTMLLRSGIAEWTCEGCGHSVVYGSDEVAHGRSSWPRRREH